MSAMTFGEYQKAALRTASPKDKKNELFHLVLGLVGEAGEIAEKFKKIVRDNDSDLDKKDMQKELGDALWYIAVLADHLGIKLEDIADANITKLASRQARGTLSGSGDNR